MFALPHHMHVNFCPSGYGSHDYVVQTAVPNYAESPGLVADGVIVSFFTHTSWAFDVFTTHLLIVECHGLHLMFCFPFFLFMPIVLDCGQTQTQEVSLYYWLWQCEKWLVCEYSSPLRKADVRGQVWHVLKNASERVLSPILPWHYCRQCVSWAYYMYDVCNIEQQGGAYVHMYLKARLSCAANVGIQP